MQRILRRAAVALLWVALAAPLSFVLTFLLFPFWYGLEEWFGIEAVGHSGPADWCFYVTFGTVCAALLWGALRRKRPSQKAAG